MNPGDIYWVDLNPTKEAEIRKKRPCVLIGATPINKARRTVVVLPLSSSSKSHPPIAITVAALNKKAIAVCDQIRAVDKGRLIEKAGSLSMEDLR